MRLGKVDDLISMKLFITDHADPSVGLMPSNYEIDVPFEKDSDKEALDDFRNKVEEIYKTYSFGEITLLYDFEAEAIGKSFSDYGLNNG